ncbi:hypothetical protein [Pseudomonas atacamensis]|uniref:hypothetical protein n=1 Tax=Pseudomonas atacamensis TaxID=2565368 RepID=UPI002492B1C4|nr:hypothetical protein [Pseudomonas atacamensis]
MSFAHSEMLLIGNRSGHAASRHHSSSCLATPEPHRASSLYSPVATLSILAQLSRNSGELLKPLREHMKRVERDFITLFNCLWYRDFPVSEVHALAGRADWTIHLGLVVRQCSTLLGARALFEQGGRTDAVIRYSDTDTLSFVEWEWKRAHTDINEFSKLLQKTDGAVFQTFIGYSRVADLKATIEQIGKHWRTASKPLITFLITYEVSGRSRRFKELQTYMFAKGKYKKVRSQPALPWEVNRRKANSESEDTA